MSRQLFLHHYLPAHLSACLVTGALVQFLFSRGFDGPVSPGVIITATRMPGLRSPTGIGARDHDQALLRIVGAVIVVAVVIGFIWFAPIAYGYPGCSVKKLLWMQWLDTWDFQFTK